MVGPANLRYFAEHLNIQQGIPSGLGGTVLHPLIKELIRREHRVVLFTLDTKIIKPVIFEGNRLKVYVGPYRARHRARDFFAIERAFLKKSILQENQVEFLHAHWTYEFALAALDSGKPTLVTAHDAPLQILRYNPTLYWFMRILMAFSVVRKTNFMTAVSAYTGNHYRKSMMYRKNLSIVPNGLPILNLGTDQEKKSEQNIIFASVANGWGRLKNTSTLIKAFSIVQKKLQQAELWLFGTGHGKGESAETWAKQKNLTKNVCFMGFTNHEEMLRLLANKANILVHPSREEAFSMILAETMMLGIPAIGGKNSGGVPSTLNYGQAGWLVDINSPRELAQAMIKMAESQEIRKSQGKAAQEFATKNFAIDRVTNLYENIYNHLVT